MAEKRSAKSSQPVTAEETVPSRKKSFDPTSYHIYISRVLKDVTPSCGITENGLTVVNDLLNIFIEDVMRTVNLLISDTGVKTVTSRDVQFAIRMLMPQLMGKHALSEGVTACSRYDAASGGDGTHSRAARAGLHVSVSRIERRLVALSLAQRKGQNAPVFLAAAVEYLAAEILELSSTQCLNMDRRRIKPRHVFLAIQADPELRALFRSVVFNGGVVPQVGTVSQEKKKRRPKKAVTETKKAKVDEAVPKKTAKGKKTANGKKTKTAKGDDE